MSHRPSIISQIIVQVSIIGVGRRARASFSYTDPETGQSHVHEPTCTIGALRPFQTVYALDYPSTRNGWFFRKHVEASGNSRDVPHNRTGNRLIMITEFDSIDGEQSFYLMFQNLITGKRFHVDPQEGNITPPK
jgi:hypothetical protein